MTENVLNRRRRTFVLNGLLLLILVGGGFAVRWFRSGLNETERFLVGHWRGEAGGKLGLDLAPSRIVWDMTDSRAQWSATAEQFVFEIRRPYSMRSIRGVQNWFQDVFDGPELMKKQPLRRIDENTIEVDGIRYIRLTPIEAERIPRGGR